MFSRLHLATFISHQGIRLIPAGVCLIVCGSLLEAAEKPVDLNDVRDKIVRWGGGEYPRSADHDATCTVIVVVDPVSGKVTSDYIESSSGDHYLNYKSLEMMKKFIFKPGSPHLIRTTFAFGEAARRNLYRPDRYSQLNKVLEPSLGQKALVQGSLPDYPRETAWTNKHGTGVFDLHVDHSGAVTSVAVKKSSGDAPFDEVMVRAMRQWRFRKGPMEIELPLYFALTPEKFTVRIPKYP